MEGHSWKVTKQKKEEAVNTQAVQAAIAAEAVEGFEHRIASFEAG